MGQGSDEHDEFSGDSCLQCFPANMTPRYIKAVFTGLELCPETPPETERCPDAPILMELQNCDRLHYFGADGNWGANYFMNDEGNSSLFLDNIDEQWFSSSKGGACATNFANQTDCINPEVRFHEGHGCVMWTPDTGCASIARLLAALGMAPGPYCRYEFWPIDDHYTTVKICNIQESTRIHIKIDPDLL